MDSTSLAFGQPLLTSIQLDPSSDSVAICLFILAASFLYISRGTRKPKGYHLLFLSPQIEDGLVGSNGKLDPTKAIESRDINEKIKRNNSDVVIFWGSQSGKAEKVAQDLGRQCRKHYGIKATVADLSNYDHDHLQNFPPDKYAIFVVSTFGEGDPPDNAADFFDYLAGLKKDSTRLQNLHYYAFGLGDRKYYSYNRFVDVLDQSLTAAGANRLGFVGKADDSLPEDDSLPVWTDLILAELMVLLGRSVKSSIGMEYEPELQLVDSKNTSVPTSDPMVSMHGQQQKITKATVREATMLSKAGQGPDYLHIEFDISDKKTVFKAGDHVAIWPVNPDGEVQRLANLFKWNENTLSAPVSVKVRQIIEEDEEDASLPTDTTRRALLSHYLDINGHITPEVIAVIANYASNENAKSFLQSLVTPDGKIVAEVKDRYLNVGKLMQLADSNGANNWPDTLFEWLLQVLPRIQPRYFSIASSPKVGANRLAITVSVVARPHSNSPGTFYGLATNYLYAHSKAFSNVSETSSGQQRLIITRNEEPRYDLIQSKDNTGGVFLKIRPSTFKLPVDIQTPILMIAAGSGIAPFRAFVQERAHAAMSGKSIGRMVLFFGIRSMQEDFLYEDEWNKIKEQLDEVPASDNIFDMHLAISRPTAGTKKYTQDVLHEQKDDVLALLNGNAALYICGSMKLSAGVKDALKKMLESDNSWDESTSDQYLNDLRASGRLREDVWA